MSYSGRQVVFLTALSALLGAAAVWQHSGTTAAPLHSDRAALAAAATEYFGAWNAHDPARLQASFAERASLRDWVTNVTGTASDLRDENAKIWKANPRIRIVVSRQAVDVASQTVVAEATVHVGNAADERLLVVDVLAFDARGKIVAVRAYKG